MDEHAQKGQTDLVKVAIDLGEGQWHGHVAETMWAAPVADHRYRLDNVPFYALGLSYGDVVVAAPDDDGQLRVRGVLERGGHSTYRVFVTKTVDDPGFSRFWSRLEKLGCSYERATERLLAIDVPRETDIYRTYAVLEEGKKKGVWDFEEGHCGHPLKASA
jgi:hypothetical protein